MLALLTKVLQVHVSRGTWTFHSHCFQYRFKINFINITLILYSQFIHIDILFDIVALFY